MKTKSIINFIALMCMCVTFCACSEEVVYNPIIYNGVGTADFSVTNVTTGETLENKGVQIGEITTLTVHPGDVLRLDYEPPTEYSQYTWKATYELFDETFTEYAPYSMEYTVKNVEAGEYAVICIGTIEEENVQFEGSDSGSVYLNVIRD